MPTEFLAAAQELAYGHYGGPPSNQQLAGYFHLDGWSVASWLQLRVLESPVPLRVDLPIMLGRAARRVAREVPQSGEPCRDGAEPHDPSHELQRLPPVQVHAGVVRAGEARTPSSSRTWRMRGRAHTRTALPVEAAGSGPVPAP